MGRRPGAACAPGQPAGGRTGRGEGLRPGRDQVDEPQRRHPAHGRRRGPGASGSGPRTPTSRCVLEPVPPGQAYPAVQIAAMAAGTAWDVFETWADIVEGFAERGGVLDLERYTKVDLKPEDIKDFYPWQWNAFRLYNIRWGMPKYVNVMTLWVNKDLFEQERGQAAHQGLDAHRLRGRHDAPDQDRGAGRRPSGAGPSPCGAGTASGTASTCGAGAWSTPRTTPGPCCTRSRPWTPWTGRAICSGTGGSMAQPNELKRTVELGRAQHQLLQPEDRHPGGRLLPLRRGPQRGGQVQVHVDARPQGPGDAQGAGHERRLHGVEGHQGTRTPPGSWSSGCPGRTSRRCRRSSPGACRCATPSSRSGRAS